MTEFIDDSEVNEILPGSQERVTHEIEGIGPVRARVGTSTAELAGAAAYWQGEAKRIRNQLLDEVADIKAKAWREGFLTGFLCFGLVGGILGAYIALH